MAADVKPQIYPGPQIHPGPQMTQITQTYSKRLPLPQMVILAEGAGFEPACH